MEELKPVGHLTLPGPSCEMSVKFCCFGGRSVASQPPRALLSTPRRRKVARGEREKTPRMRRADDTCGSGLTKRG